MRHDRVECSGSRPRKSKTTTSAVQFKSSFIKEDGKPEKIRTAQVGNLISTKCGAIALPPPFR